MLKIKFLFLLVFVFLSLLYSSISAQNQGKIIGQVVDANSGMAVEYANIVVYAAKDSTVVTGTISASDGKFIIDPVPFGKYFVNIHFIGYDKVEIKQVILTPPANTFNTGIVKINFSSRNLEEVMITGKKEALEYNLDKKVINVDKNLASSGGTAVDVMQTIPSVQVDIDGGISLRGSSNVNLLIDGRPSTYATLDQIPASMIESVELVTNPSARYDPDGMTGIINIVLKKKKTPGWNGMLNVNVGTGDKYNTSLNINFRKNKLNLFVNYDNRNFAMRGNGNSLLTNSLSDTATYLEQQQLFRRKMQFNNFKAGFDYFIDDRNSIAFLTKINNRNFFSHEKTRNILSSELTSVLDYYELTSDNNNYGYGTDLVLNYKNTGKRKGEELTADIYYDGSKRESNQFVVTDYFKPDYSYSEKVSGLQNSLSNTKSRLWVAQSDYVRPIGNGGRMETGIKGTYRDTKSDYRIDTSFAGSDSWITDTSRSNIFNYEETILAAYMIYSNSISKFLYQIGGRFEQAFNRADQKTINQVYSRSYPDFFPSAHLKYKFAERHSMQISYSRRVSRPGTRSLNPFVNYSDPKNISAGNPYLKPEYTNSIELGHSLGFLNTTLSSTVFLRHTTGIISQIMTIYPDGTTFTTYRNQNSGTSYGLEFIWSQRLLKVLKFDASLSGFKSQFSGSDIGNFLPGKDISWTSKLNVFATVVKGLDLQGSIYYSAPVLTVQSGGGRGMFMMGGGQGVMGEMFMADLGIRKEVWKSNGTFSLRIQDIFNSMRYNMDTYGEGFTSSISRKRESRVLFVGFSYKINDYKRNREKIRTEDSNGGMEDF